jgi:hypothetical protein
MPEGYDPNDTFAEGMLGSQAGLSSSQRKGGPALPGFENLGEDAVMMGGIEVAEGIPEGMQFIPASVPDGNFDLTVPITSAGESFRQLCGSTSKGNPCQIPFFHHVCVIYSQHVTLFLFIYTFAHNR